MSAQDRVVCVRQEGSDHPSNVPLLTPNTNTIHDSELTTKAIVAIVGFSIFMIKIIVSGVRKRVRPW